MPRILDVRDALTTLVNTYWTEQGREDHANDVVIAPWAWRLDTATLVGRKVLVFPAAYAGVPATRGDDQDDYGFTIVVAERYLPQGDPPDEWIDGRVRFCEGLLAHVGDPRRPRLLAVAGDPNSGLWPEVAEMPTVYDVEELAERKLFVAVLTVTFREHAG